MLEVKKLIVWDAKLWPAINYVQIINLWTLDNASLYHFKSNDLSMRSQMLEVSLAYPSCIYLIHDINYASKKVWENFPVALSDFNVKGILMMLV